ncbi:MAG: TIM barrel protein [Solirubrobacterales bacterium]
MGSGIRARLGLNVPYEWWPAAPLLKSFEAAGFAWAQIPSPPASVLSNPHDCLAHARSARQLLGSTAMRAVVHGPSGIGAGERHGDLALEGLLAYAAELGAEQVVYHARDFPDGRRAEDRALAETRSLARLAARAEALGVLIAVENLAPVYPGPERLGHSPAVLRTLCKRIASASVGICLDLGHAHVVASGRGTALADLIAPALEFTTLFHVHDNLGSRRLGPRPAELDPLRLDLHLPPGRGSLPWGEVAAPLEAHPAPVVLEIHPPHRPAPEELLRSAEIALAGAAATA